MPILLPRHTVAHPHGQLTILHEDGRIEEGDLLTCGHCQYTWRVQPGSGRRRSWCRVCNQPLCAEKPLCMVACNPIEAQLERGKFLY